MNSPRLIATSLLVLLSLILVGCVTSAKLYEGPDLPRNKIAVVTMDLNLGVVTVDGVKGRGTMTLQMLPGKHTMSMSYGDGRYSSTAPQVVSFTAEAGKSYHVKANVSPGKWYPSVVEVAANR